MRCYFGIITISTITMYVKCRLNMWCGEKSRIFRSFCFSLLRRVSRFEFCYYDVLLLPLKMVYLLFFRSFKFCIHLTVIIIRYNVVVFSATLTMCIAFVRFEELYKHFDIWKVVLVLTKIVFLYFLHWIPWKYIGADYERTTKKEKTFRIFI